MPETFTARFQLREVVENGTLMIAQLLISQGGKHSPLDTVLYLLSHNTVVNTLDNQGNPPVTQGIMVTKIHVAELLLTVPSIFDSTLLREAVQNGRLDTVQSLPTHGADINTP